MDLKYIIGFIFSSIGAILTIEGIAYRRRRDAIKDKEAEREKIDKKMLALKTDSELKIEKVKQEFSDKLSRIVINEREKMHSEINRLDAKIDSTAIVINDHVKYSKANHPTNDTVFPFLKRLESKLDSLQDHQLEEKEKEIQRLQNLLEKERG